jgi:hydrogenase maturation factor HypE
MSVNTRVTEPVGCSGMAESSPTRRRLQSAGVLGEVIPTAGGGKAKKKAILLAICEAL